MTIPPPYAVPPQGYPAYGQPPPGYGYVLEPTSPGGQPLAAFDKRLLAVLIDTAIVGAVSLVVIVPVYFVAFFRLVDQLDAYDTTDGLTTPEIPFSVFGEFFAIFAAAWLVLLVGSYLYQVELALRWDGQTPGKRIMKLRIVPLNPAEPLTRRQLAARYFSTLGLSLVPGLSWVDGLWQLWDKPYQQCLHDKAARTVVVRLST